MEFSAGQIAALIGGKVEGDEAVLVSDFANIEEGQEGCLSFLDNPKYAHHLYASRSSVVLVKTDFELEQELQARTTLIRVDDPRMALAKLMSEYLKSLPQPTGISEDASIHENAHIGEDVYIGAGARIAEGAIIEKGARIHENVVIGRNARIGEKTELMPNVTVYADSIIGKECMFHSGVVIGADGFGFAPNSETNYFKIPHIGNVIIEDHVEIGCNTCVDRATMGSTIIRRGVKLDNLIQVGHNVEIGEFCVVAAQTGFAGTTTIGKRNMIGGQVGFAGHMSIADDVKIAAQSGIAQSITEEGAIVQGSPAYAIGDFKRSYVLFRGLPKLKAQLDSLLKAKNDT